MNAIRRAVLGLVVSSFAAAEAEGKPPEQALMGEDKGTAAADRPPMAGPKGKRWGPRKRNLSCCSR